MPAAIWQCLHDAQETGTDNLNPRTAEGRNELAKRVLDYVLEGTILAPASDASARVRWAGLHTADNNGEPVDDTDHTLLLSRIRGHILVSRGGRMAPSTSSRPHALGAGGRGLGGCPHPRRSSSG